ncbi:hypothetical protein CW731_13200 [Polaribacter sp. ALD11]|uniref:LytR/AlgR family response regulator transcription factor n=1 Tax=Polaribacter sp. ALD11 TaxID=2058137 RepID=UPI000C314107|nr:LytTR family transcriptional regulator DNA-binding domain-containing protein [Polaribacter sp. ALD11]AUC86176.1 hypothetical protein CW731_13200 [Polaribacter sp. ALD11]
MEPVKIYILEDEIIIQQLLKETLETLDYNICGTQINAELALLEIKEVKPDIVFLDIRVAGNKTGIWLGNQLDIPIIYLTAFSDPKTITKAIKTKPVSYLVKPFNIKQLFIALELALCVVAEKKEITIKVRDRFEKIRVEDIWFAKKEDQYLTLYLKESVKLIRSSVQEFLTQVNSSSFLQVHRSYVVNKNYVTAFNSKGVRIDKNKIPISQKYLEKVYQELA